MLQIKNYSMEYIKGIRVIDGLNLSVREGDIYAFVGRNGAGKTTTIKSYINTSFIYWNLDLYNPKSISYKSSLFTIIITMLIILIQKWWIPTIHVRILQYLDKPTCNLDLTRSACHNATSLKSDLANHMPEKNNGWGMSYHSVS